MKSLCCLLTVLISTCVLQLQSSSVFLVDPVSIAAVNGTKVEFSCTAVGDVEEISYRVNGSSASSQAIQDKGFAQLQTEILNNGTLQRRNLTVIVSSMYNNTEIVCTTDTGANINMSSEIAHLTVQGPLFSVGDLFYNFTDSTMLKLSWSPPFTLPGTTIIGYNISVTSNGTTTDFFTPNSYYVLWLHNITDSPCNEMNITVSGYNELRGDSSTISGIYLPSVPSSDTIIPVGFEVLINFHLKFNINVTNLCVGEQPSTISVDLFNNYDASVMSHKDVMLHQDTESNILSANTTLTVLAGQIYTINISLMNIAGVFDIKITMNLISYLIPPVPATSKGLYQTSVANTSTVPEPSVHAALSITAKYIFISAATVFLTIISVTLLLSVFFLVKKKCKRPKSSTLFGNGKDDSTLELCQVSDIPPSTIEVFETKIKEKQSLSHCAYRFSPMHDSHPTVVSQFSQIQKEEVEMDTTINVNKCFTTTERHSDGHPDIVPFNEEGLFYHSYKYGVTIIIPEGAAQGSATLQFRASLILKDFKCEGPFEPVSPFVFIHIDPVLTKPATLYIPHYVMADTVEDKMKLYLLTKGHGEKDMFKVNNKLETNIFPTLVRTSGTHFCTVCLASTPVPKKRCHLLVAIKQLESGSQNVDVCVLYSHNCLQKLKMYYEGWTFDQGPANFVSGDIQIKVEIPENADWEYIFRGHHREYIREEQIDFYKLLGCTPQTVSEEDTKTLQFYEEEGSYPPRFKLSFTPIHFSAKIDCQAKIIIYGHDDNISIPIQLKGDISSPQFPSISSDSGFSNTSPSDSLQLSETRNTDNDDFVIDVMSFLETHLTADWMKFGHHLGLDMDLLHHIEETTGHDTVRCIKQIMLSWRRKSPDGSHDSVIRGLKSSGYSLLSDMVNLWYSNKSQSTTFCKICQRNHGPETSDYELLSHVLGNCEILKAEPEVADLMSLIAGEIPAEWELFGAQLNIQQSEMDAIKVNNLGNCRLCFQHLLSEWKRTKPSLITWQTIIKALYSPSVRGYALAEKVYKHLTAIK